MENSIISPLQPTCIDCIFKSLYYFMRKQDSSSHPHLLMKQIQSQLKVSGLNLKDIIMQMNVDYYQLSGESMPHILHKIIRKVTSQFSYKQFEEQAHLRMQEQIETLYTSQSRKHTYLVDCFKEVTAFPIAKQRQNGILNLEKLYMVHLSKELRRVVWNRKFNVQHYRKKYLLIDREVTPYKILEELKLSLEKLTAKQKITLKQNQKDIALRIVQYFVKANNKIPHRYHNYLAIIVIDLFSFYTISKITELGAIVLGLVGLSESYRQPDIELRFKRVMKAITIVDEQSAAHIAKYYLQSGNGKKDLNQCYQYFRLTLGASHLPIQITHFLIDQLIIRQFCSFDMYVLFAIVILVVSDQFEQGQQQKASLKEILDRSKSIIKPQDYIDAYRAIYQSIPPFYAAEDMQNIENNELLLEMASCSVRKVDEDKGDFIVDIDKAPRIGYHS